MTKVGSRTDEKQEVRLESPLILSGKPMLVAGLRGHFTKATWDGIPEQWKRFMSYGPIPAQVGNVHYGLTLQTSNGIEYLSGVEVSDTAGLPAEFSTSKIPAQTYAVFTHREHVSKIFETMEAIRHNWLPSSGREVLQPSGNAPAFFERYGEKFNPGTGKGDIEIWVPVKA